MDTVPFVKPGWQADPLPFVPGKGGYDAWVSSEIRGGAEGVSGRREDWG